MIRGGWKEWGTSVKYSLNNLRRASNPIAQFSETDFHGRYRSTAITANNTQLYACASFWCRVTHISQIHSHSLLFPFYPQLISLITYHYTCTLHWYLIVITKIDWFRIRSLPLKLWREQVLCVSMDRQRIKSRREKLRKSRCSRFRKREKSWQTHHARVQSRRATVHAILRTSGTSV